MIMPGEATLAGKRAVVTGAGRGIGRSIALAFANAGADVAVTARTSAELDQLVSEIQSVGRRGLAASVVESLGGIDILVNNAGNAGSHKFLNHSDELWHRMLAVNLTSV